MEPRTHLAISAALVGAPTALEPGRATATLTITAEMAADERGLAHGSFAFGLADYAAMLAVNEPTVVLTAAELRFVAPVVVGDTLLAEAVVESSEGKKRGVRVSVFKQSAEGAPVVLEGKLGCFVPDTHILDRRSKA